MAEDELKRAIYALIGEGERLYTTSPFEFEKRGVPQEPFVERCVMNKLEIMYAHQRQELKQKLVGLE